MPLPVLVRHDPGCKWSRVQEATIAADGRILSAKIGRGHDDDARRLSDSYNLHKAAGTHRGVIALRLADATGDGVVYDSRSDAVAHMHPNERWYFYLRLQAPAMSVCEAAELLHFERTMADLQGTDRDAPGGGHEVIPALTQEGRARQIEAVKTGRGAIATGLGKG